MLPSSSGQKQALGSPGRPSFSRCRGTWRLHRPPARRAAAGRWARIAATGAPRASRPDAKLLLKWPPTAPPPYSPLSTSNSRKHNVCPPQTRNPERTGRRRRQRQKEAAPRAERVPDQPARKRWANFSAAAAACTAGDPAAAGMQITWRGPPIIGRDGERLHQ